LLGEPLAKELNGFGLTSVAKRRNLLGLANTLAKELNDSEELVRRF